MMEKVHSHDEILAHLKEDLKDELEDIVKYGELHKSLMAHGLFKEASDVQAIASDEYTHACAIKKILEAHDVDTSKNAELTQLWDKVYDVFDD